MKEIIKKIKQKKELSDIPNNFIEIMLKNYLQKYKISMPKSEKQQKVIIKEIRAELRNYAGRFQVKSNYQNRLKLLQQNKIQEILKTHSSTKERLENYDEINKWIYNTNPKSILDLACGLNPIALAKQGIFYIAVDIKEDELKLIDLFFKKNNLDGKTIIADITKIENFPKTDICLIFKTLDIIEQKGHKRAKEIIQKINTQTIIASFSTKTLSGKPMNYPRRLWFENLLKSLNYRFEIKKTNNEIFYFIKASL
jgi:hypothetical protein